MIEDTRASRPPTRRQIEKFMNSPEVQEVVRTVAYRKAVERLESGEPLRAWPTLEEVSAHTGVPLEQVRAVINAYVMGVD